MTNVDIRSGNPPFPYSNVPPASELMEIANGTVASHTTTRVALSLANGETFVLIGSFTGFDGNGLPTGGTVNGFLWDIPATPGVPFPNQGYAWNHFSVDFNTLWTIFENGDTTGFQSTLFGGNDRIAFSGGPIFGGDGNDILYSASSPDDPAVVISGGDGNDIINYAQYERFGDRPNDQIDGGAGNDTLELATTTAVLRNVRNVDNVVLDTGTGGGYHLTTTDGIVTAGQALKVNGAALQSDEVFTFNGSRETDGNFVVTGGAANDHLVTGAGNDFIQGGLGADLLDGGAGSNRFVYSSAAESTSTGFDTITGFNGALDRITGVTVSGHDAAVTSGHLSKGTFDTDLANAIGSGQLAAHTEVVFTPTTGGYAGSTFLIVDVNGEAGYQGGEDIVIRLVDGTNLPGVAG